jgi:hypothetical protein
VLDDHANQQHGLDLLGQISLTNSHLWTALLNLPRRNEDTFLAALVEEAVMSTRTARKYLWVEQDLEDITT